ncbi:hypothetical protein DL95DRAFT_524386 [Leptodontidium sp. 2 PMI_412]|nr:hypothetical protein DL95DRAFT_524386 [Leptodontidium sp. 2 PMI_412]
MVQPTKTPDKGETPAAGTSSNKRKSSNKSYRSIKLALLSGSIPTPSALDSYYSELGDPILYAPLYQQYQKHPQAMAVMQDWRAKKGLPGTAPNIKGDTRGKESEGEASPSIQGSRKRKSDEVSTSTSAWGPQQGKNVSGGKDDFIRLGRPTTPSSSHGADPSTPSKPTRRDQLNAPSTSKARVKKQDTTGNAPSTSKARVKKQDTTGNAPSASNARVKKQDTTGNAPSASNAHVKSKEDSSDKTTPSNLKSKEKADTEAAEQERGRNDETRRYSDATNPAYSGFDIITDAHQKRFQIAAENLWQAGLVTAQTLQAAVKDLMRAADMLRGVSNRTTTENQFLKQIDAKQYNMRSRDISEAYGATNGELPSTDLPNIIHLDLLRKVVNLMKLHAGITKSDDGHTKDELQEDSVRHGMDDTAVFNSRSTEEYRAKYGNSEVFPVPYPVDRRDASAPEEPAPKPEDRHAPSPDIIEPPPSLEVKDEPLEAYSIPPGFKQRANGKFVALKGDKTQYDVPPGFSKLSDGTFIADSDSDES